MPFLTAETPPPPSCPITTLPDADAHREKSGLKIVGICHLRWGLRVLVAEILDVDFAPLSVVVVVIVVAAAVIRRSYHGDQFLDAGLVPVVVAGPGEKPRFFVRLREVAALREHDAVAETRRDREEPERHLVAKHLLHGTKGQLL